MQKFSNGARVRWTDGDQQRTGVVTDSNVAAPEDAGDHAETRFHRVTSADGTTYVVSEIELEPTGASPEA